ncbi:MAG: hypothetical protein JWN67_1197 [Actinomycetia bacterium]|nr:hypothetical protein [Actinomycetes bacterium]
MTSHHLLIRTNAEPHGPAIWKCLPSADTVHVTTVRKLLLAVLLVSLAGSAFGAGTFATFNATTTNAGSAFSTGSLVLTNTKGGGSLCYSNGTSANGVAGANTDTNANTNCDAVFTAGISKPGDAATQTVTINNAGSLAAAGGLTLYSGTTAITNCADTPRPGEIATGTGSMCETANLTITDTTTSKCIYGGGASQEVRGNTAVFANPGTTATITASTNDQMTFNVGGAGNVTITIAPGVYSLSMGGTGNTPFTNPTMETAIQNALITANLPVLSGIGTDGFVYFAAKNPGATLVVTNPASRNAGATIGTGTNGTPTMTAVYPATQDTHCSYTPAHSIMNFTRMFAPSGAAGAVTAQAPITALASLPVSTAKVFSVSIGLDLAATNYYQGRLATFGMTWQALQ